MPVSDWIQAGKAGAQSVSDLFQVARDNSPDYGEIAKTAMNARSKERQAAVRAEANVRKAGLQAMAKVKQAEIEVDASEKILGQKLDAKRKAGYVGALGSIAVGGFAAIDNNRTKREQAERDAAEQAIWDEWSTRQGTAISDLRDQISQMEAELESGGSGSGPITVQRPGSLDAPLPTAPTTAPGGSAGPSGSSTSTSAVSSGGVVSQGQMEQMLISRGVPAGTARTMAAVGMAESAGKPGNDTVKSGLDPQKKNEYSVGLWQINTQAHGDKLTRRGWSIDDLRDPEKNADIAVEVWEEAGRSLTPWGAFTNGSYQDFLKL